MMNPSNLESSFDLGNFEPLLMIYPLLSENKIDLPRIVSLRKKNRTCDVVDLPRGKNQLVANGSLLWNIRSMEQLDVTKLV